MLTTLSRYQKPTAWFFVFVFYVELLTLSLPVRAEFHPRISMVVNTGSLPNSGSFFPTENRSGIIHPVLSGETNKQSSFVPDRKRSEKKFEMGPGPTQPEMGAFSSVNNNNMVDLFTGDFSYNIPLMDVGGYPVNISYRSGISMDQEASWVGLGWNVNPGTITRNMRGLPDDFDGADSIRKVSSIKENKTIGVTGGLNVELTGVPLGLGASLGVFHNNYKGWGIENSVNASIDAGIGSGGALSGGLSLTNNSQEGLTIAPSLAISLGQKETEEKNIGGSLSLSLPYNSRGGLKGLQMSAGIRQYQQSFVNSKNGNGEDLIKATNKKSAGSSFSSFIGFASPTATPTITMPFTSRQFSFTAKVGSEAAVLHPNFYISGYVSKQQIDPEDTLLALPAYGYLYLQDGSKTKNPLLDFNREKELIFRDKPPVPNIGVPYYTYDAFSISGEGTGGMFRAYRGDIGYVHDHFMRTKDGSAGASVDVGLGDMVHAGIDINVSRSFTQNSAWLEDNNLANIINFRNSDTSFEASYFRNPGEKSINSKSFYDAVGGDDVVTVGLYQAGVSSSSIQATNYLNRYRNKQKVGTSLLTPDNVTKQNRDKRAQVISYLTAKEADAVGLSHYIEDYTPNQFGLSNCISNFTQSDGTNGLYAEYFQNQKFSGTPYAQIDDSVNFDWVKGWPSIPVSPPLSHFPADHFSVRWTGRFKAPATGQDTIYVSSDDGIRLWIDDSLLINKWYDHASSEDNVKLNLVAGQMYKIRLEYYEDQGKSSVKLKWAYPGQPKQVIPGPFLYLPPEDVIIVNPNLKLERRITSYRKPNHLSEIDVLNPDGRKYVYGIPVYNFKQKEATFSVNGKDKGNLTTGLVKYANGVDNTTANQNGQDHYFNSEEVPAYAHSFLLTGILSPDYVDLTGNGISDDDLGDAIKFKYSKVNGPGNPYRWRAPYVNDSVTFNDGLKTDTRDDKGSYTCGEKELWYLHSIESKNMIATFVTENRTDQVAIDESGHKYNDGSAKRLKEINLYSKADFMKNGTHAKPIKTVHFDYSYELCPGVNKPLSNDGKLTLKKIWFTYNGNELKVRQNPYIFNYNAKNPAYNLKSYDRWGNYKEPLQNPGSTTGNLITNAEYPYALQDSATAAQNAAAWALDSIYLPSGGSLKIAYESDDYAYVQNKRAMQLFKLVGLGATSGLTNPDPLLYKGNSDNLYVYVQVPSAVSSKQDVYQKYLTDVKKLFFKLFVQMPTDQWGKGSEYISCYADLDSLDGYGTVSGKPNVIWIKINGISLKGDGPGSYSPLAKAAIQFLRLNLPSKAYPGSQVGDNLDLAAAVQMIFSVADNIKDAVSSFDNRARGEGWAVRIDTSRSYVRLNSPKYQKFGGGYRVKRITIYDNWNKMTAQRTAAYGQEYTYKTVQNINGTDQLISSGVASWEPGIGGEENPFRLPIEYTEDISVLGPVAMGYSEEPLGESLFPSPLVGYSKVRVRTINHKNIRSANGYEETGFYTAYDFPTYTDRTLIDADTKKRFKPAISNFLRINARYYLTISQGFKVELNDMHGKLRSQAYYPENDPNNPVSYTENFYRVDDPLAEHKRLSNVVMAMKQDGTVDTTALIGKDVELMVDMREQQSVTSGNNISVNTELFAIPFIPPFFVIPSFLSLGQRQENKFRSVGTTKVIQRYGILDSVVHIDKGSKISTKDLVYDAETGDVLLTRTQNEFNDSIFTFNYPAYWAYDGMGPAYKNIDVVANHVSFSQGKITGGLAVPEDDLFTAGDELLVSGKQYTGTSGGCTPFASFPGQSKIWAIDSAVAGVGPSRLYFMDYLGAPYTGSDVSVKVIRSGRKNLGGSIGAVTLLSNPLVKNMAGQYQLTLNSASRVVSASASEFKDIWNVESRNAQRTLTEITCPSTPYCYDTIPASYQPVTISTCFSPAKYVQYGALGTWLYDFTVGGSFTTIDDETGFWNNPGDNEDGRLNRTGIWACGLCGGSPSYPTCSPGQTWLGFYKSIYIPTTDTVFIGIGGDNQVKVNIDQSDSVQMLDPLLGGNPYYRWHVFPVYLTRGYHNFHIQGWNADNSSPATFGAEIYNISRSQLQYADSNAIKAHTLFSTITVAENNDTFPGGYSCPIGYQMDSSDGVHHNCIKPVPCKCDTVISQSCYNAITDTTINPFFTDILGNWRDYRAYTYYTNRAETDPTAPINARTNGTIPNFAPFWNFQSGKLVPGYDTTRWVWNTQMTLFNKKGFELENKDALGRYNAGLYGYNFALPVAAIQNAQYRESAFEGFEDYDYTTQGCDTTCPSGRHFDFTAYLDKITSTQKHSGKYSLQLNTGQQASINVKLGTLASDTVTGKLSAATATDVCSSETIVSGIRANSNLVHPLFSPFAGKQMLISAWVKEAQDCSCKSYVNNQITLVTSGGTPGTVNFSPSGPIIEGWQRYEGLFTIPSDDTSLTVSMKATGSVTVYFDDLRIEPFNANMKSFVYNPVNLRLMAELDENNYATFYEYDDDGTLIRVKKETERGIQTIKETRSALYKQ